MRCVLVLGNDLVVSGSWDGTVRAWSLARGDGVQVLHIVFGISQGLEGQGGLGFGSVIMLGAV